MKEEFFNKDFSLAVQVCEICNENKAENIKIIDVSRKTSLTDYFVIMTANSNVHAKSLMDHIEEELEKQEVRVIRREMGDGRWFVLDYGSFIVHILTEDLREHYQLEKLWSEGKNTLDKDGLKKFFAKKGEK
jgi:ribosome-associated protein